jgi:purine catabolism regulator
VIEATALDEADILILERAATVATLALIQHQAVQETEQRLRRDLLEDLLTSERWSLGRFTDHARSLGWQLEAKPVVILLDYGEVRRRSLTEHGPDQGRLRWVREQFFKIVRQTLAEHNPLGIMVEHSNGFTLLPHLPATETSPVQEQARVLVDALVQHIQAGKLRAGYTIACGGFHQGVEGLRYSFREAQQALEIGSRLMMRQPIWFDEVQLYLLLEHSGRSEELRDWFKRTLGLLVEYDLRNKTDMVQTLESYFDTGQKLQEAAQALHIHPNTLKYRLRRIEQVLGQDPFKGENQLRFYLATKVARLIR